MDKPLAAIGFENFDVAKKLVSEVFHGGFPVGRYVDQGMEGSLLYHMEMVDKMEAEPRLILQELKVEAPDIEKQLHKFCNDFASDVAELTRNLLPREVNPHDALKSADLEAKEKISLFKELTKKLKMSNPCLKKRI